MAENIPKRPFLLAGKKRKKVTTIVFCLLVAMVFWFFNALNNDYSAVINYPVNIKYNPTDYVLDSKSDKYVKLSTAGYGWYLLYYSLGIGIDPINISLNQFVDNQYFPDNKLLEIAKIHLQNVEVKQVVSDTFRINAEPKSNKRFFLRLDTKRINLPKGKQIDSLRLEPQFITCYGPKNELIILPDTISFALPDSFVERDFSSQVPVHYHPSKNIRQNTSSVKVSFKLK